MSRSRWIVVLVYAALPLLARVLADGAPAGQADAARASRTLPAAAARTADGKPNLEGYWTNDSYTPLERPAEVAGKAFFTPQEAAAFVRTRLDRLEGQSRTDIHYDDAIWQAEPYSKQANLRTSLITDPADGKIPPLTGEARQREAAKAAARRGQGPSDSAQHRSLGERCITWGNVGPPMVPPTYNANFQIVQTPDQVLIRHEMMHDVRVVYLDGRPHVDAGVRYLSGDSRGRWEGDTLVVDTTNFTNATPFRGSPANTRQDIFSSDRLHVVERFTRIDANTIRYQFTVDDPGTWVAPWSGEMPIRRFAGPIYEYACHEGNYGLPNILSAARAQEREAATSTK
jgi:hypothetical protein